MQKSKQIQGYAGSPINETNMVISNVKKVFLLLYFQRMCYEILIDCQCSCFQFVVSFKTIFYFLKSQYF